MGETAASFAPAASCVGVSKGFVAVTKEGVHFSLGVSLGAKRTSIESPYGESAVKLKVAAPPVSGKANVEVDRFLLKLLGVRRSEVAVVRGGASSFKRVLGRSVEEVSTQKALAADLP